MAVESIIRGLLNRGKSVRDIEEPWWSRRYGDILGAVPGVVGAFQQAKKEKAVQANRDLTTISSFEARLGNKLNNYEVSGDVYNEAKMPELKESINNFYDQYSSKFPELISEFSEERDAILGKINSYSIKNKEKDALLSKINPTKEKLFSIVETLNTTATTDFNPDERVKFRQEVYDTMEEITKLDKIIDDPYYAGIDGWADTIEDVKYGLSDASKQLITQINTWDSKENVISKQDLNNLENAIFKNDTQGIRAINEQIVQDKTARMTQYETDYNTYLKNYQAIASFANTQTYKDMKKIKDDEYAKAIKDGRTVSEDFWFEYVDPTKLPGAPEEGVNLQNVDAQLIKLKTDAENIDANYRNEHIAGASIAEVLNKPLPWDKGKASLEQKKKEHEKRMKDLGLTVSSVGGGEAVVAGDEPLEVSELHRSVAPIDPTMPTGEPRVKEGDNIDVGVFQINEPTFAKYNPKEMSEPEMIKFASDIVYNNLSDTTVGDFNHNDGWNNWSVYKNKTDDFKLARNKNDKWFLENGLSQEQLNNIDNNFKSNKDKKIARAVIWAESKGDHSAININKPEVKEPEVKGIKIDSPLTEAKDGKTVVNYSNASSTGFKRQQTNLNKIASKKYNAKENKNKYDNVRDFVKSKFEEWLRSTGKYGKYAEEDFKYFIPTKVDRKNKVNPNTDMNRYNLYYPGAFSGAKGDVRMMINPKIGSGYLGFAKDFDEFRKYLQES